MLCKVANGARELKPVDILRSSRCRDVACLVRNHERIWVTLFGGSAKVECWANTGAREWVRDEVMLSEDNGRTAERVDDIVGSDVLAGIENVEGNGWN